MTTGYVAWKEFNDFCETYMDTLYQLILIGAPNNYLRQVEDIFLLRTSELGIARDRIRIISATEFDSEYQPKAPAFCIYFGSRLGHHRDADIIARLQGDARPILPIATELTIFNSQIPPSLQAINGTKLDAPEDVETIVGTILEGLGLLRLSRRLFISYKRDESSAIAMQLFERLEGAGFDVFLDTHSIPKTEPFQEELWQRLADTDVVVLLNTKNFLGSEWTKEELAKASLMSISILQLIWPGHTQEDFSRLSRPMQLQSDDFGNPTYSDPDKYLTEACVQTLISQTESLRARSLAARQTNMISEFIAAARALSVPVTLQPGKYMVVTKKNGHHLVMIPTIGVPQAFTYYQSEDLVKTIRTSRTDGVYLLYDHLNIRNKWVRHLDWLDQYLKIQSLKLLDVKTRLPALI